MSQAKVDQHKREKANRKKEMRKERIERILTMSLLGVIAIAICVWIGFSIYGRVASDAGEQASSTVDVDMSALDGYMNGLDEETAE